MKKIILFCAFVLAGMTASAQFTMPVEYIGAFPANIITGYSPAGNVTRGYGIIGSPLSDPLLGYRVKQVSFKGVNKTDSVSLWGGWIDTVTTAGARDTVWEQLWLRAVRKPNSTINVGAGSAMARDTVKAWITDVGIDKGTVWGTYEFSDYNFNFYQMRRGIVDTGKVFYRIRALGF